MIKLIKNYDKILVLIALLILLCFTFAYDDFTKSAGDSSTNSAIKLSVKNKISFLSLDNNFDLMPGEFIYHRFSDGEEWQSIKILSSYYLRNAEVEIILSDGKKLSASLKQNLQLSQNWKGMPNTLALRIGRETIVVPFNNIERIIGLCELEVGNLGDLNLHDAEISFYQRNQFPLQDDIFKNKWTRSNSDQNHSGYDLFTPPVIYVHEGMLTTRLPESKEEEAPPESFGLILKAANRKSYPYRLCSWIGGTPYFEDLATFESTTSSRPVRNRIEPGTAYKRNENRKPGQPSLIRCGEDDPGRIFIVEHFVVQQHKNPQTGGLRPVGRAMVRDYKIPEPFEINSLMKEVFAGDVTFTLEVDLPGYEGQIIEFSSNDENKLFNVGGREYQISKIDLKEKFINILKKDPRQTELIQKSFPI